MDPADVADDLDEPLRRCALDKVAPREPAHRLRRRRGLVGEQNLLQRVAPEAEAAQAVGSEPGRIVKSLVLVCDGEPVVALMRRHSNSAVKTFSIGFEGESSFDETIYARQVAQHLGTEHTAFTVKPQTLDLLPKLVWHHDQPFGDSSAIPTYLVSTLAREHVTVALTGDGGDELFGGYNRYLAGTSIWRNGRGMKERLSSML